MVCYIVHRLCARSRSLLDKAVVEMVIVHNILVPLADPPLRRSLLQESSLLVRPLAWARGGLPARRRTADPSWQLAVSGDRAPCSCQSELQGRSKRPLRGNSVGASNLTAGSLCSPHLPLDDGIESGLGSAQKRYPATATRREHRVETRWAWQTRDKSRCQ